MKRNFAFLPVFLFITVAACFFTFQITYRKTDELWRKNVDAMIRTDSTRINDNLSEARSAVSGNFVYDVSEDKLVDGIIEGFVEGLGDKFAMYLNKNRYQDYVKSTTAGTDIGVGLNVLYDASVDGIYIIDVYDNSPAERAGIVPGDIITHINGSSVDSYGFYGAVLALGEGVQNDKIGLTLHKINGESVTTFVEKSRVEVQSITSKKMGNGIGLIVIHNFQTDSKDKFVKAMEQLIASGCEKFIIDIRNNSGGSLEGTTSILDFLLPSGTLVTVTDKSGTKNTISSDVNESPYLFAVLVNNNTVCEAEVFAAAMRNLGEAVVVGDTTYGKAAKQTLFPLPDGSALCFSTVAYIHSGADSFTSDGIVPDISVSLSENSKLNFGVIDDSEDEQLQEAINYLKKQEVQKLKD